MKNWQILLEAFGRCEEPVPLSAFSYLRMTVAERQHALDILINRGFVDELGQAFTTEFTPLYGLTPAGQVALLVGVQRLGTKNVRPRREPPSMPSLAKRTHAIAPNSVFDLARAPWTCKLIPAVELYG